MKNKQKKTHLEWGGTTTLAEKAALSEQSLVIS